MMLTAALFCIICFEFTFSLPPLSTNFNNNKNVVINPQNRYNERYLQYRREAQLLNENAGLQNRQIYPQLDKNLDTSSHTAYVRAYGQSTLQNNVRNRPVEQNIGIVHNTFERANREQFLQNPNTNENFVVPQNFEHGLNERGKSQVKQPNLASNYPQNLQINLRGYVASPEINKGLVPPKPNLANLFSTTMQKNTAYLAQRITPPSQMITGIHNSAYDVKSPTFQQPIPTLTDFHKSPSSTPSANTAPKKTYTIIYPNGTTEQSDSLEEIKRNYPYYILSNPSNINVNHKLIKEDNVASEKGVSAKHALANPTLVPILNLPSPVLLPKDYPKETLVTNTLSEETQRRLTPTIVTEQLKTYTSNRDKKYSSLEPSKNSTSGNINSSIDNASHILATQTLTKASVDTNKATSTASEPLVNETSIKLTTAINKTDNNEGQNIKYDVLENISAEDFWNPLKNIIAIPDLSNISDAKIRKIMQNISSFNENNTYEEIQPFDGNLIMNLTRTKENKNTTTGKFNPDITLLHENKTDPDINNQTDNVEENSHDYDKFSSENSQLPLNTTGFESQNFDSEIEDEQTLSDSEQYRIDEFVNSIEDMIEFIEPFVQIQNDTDANETTFDDFVPDDINGTNNDSNSNYDDALSKYGQMDQNITEPIYIPNLSLMKENDTMFWFKTTDENVWEKLSKKNSTNLFIIPPRVSVEKNTIINIYPNGTKVEEITEITRSDNGKQPVVLKTTRITQPNGETEIKYG